MNTFISKISNKEFPITDKISGKSIRQSIMLYIQQEYPFFTEEDSISLTELNYFREVYVSGLLVKNSNELNGMHKSVITALTDKMILSSMIEDTSEKMTFGQKISDKVSNFGGSWTFIISFGFFLALWIFFNSILYANKGFDPYPYIFLNLILSCIAALQAPIIMMSQNRKEEKDRERGKKDYMINLKSEIEIRALHEKIDHLIEKQQIELLEVQQIQLEMLNDILNQLNKKQ